jgi:hypothetical protein
VAVCVRALMAEGGSWAGTASELQSAASGLAGNNGRNWPKNPGALTGRLRRSQTFLRMLGIERSFTREGRAGTRTIRISAGVENQAGIVSTFSAVRTGCDNVWIDIGKPAQGLVPSSSVAAADSADAADAVRRLYGPPGPNAGHPDSDQTRFPAGDGLQGRRHWCEHRITANTRCLRR